MEESSSTTSRKHPKKNLVGGFGNYCCVPGCKSAFYDKNREKTDISLFTITKREHLRKKWLSVLKHVCRKGGTDSFDVKNPNKRIYVCEFHFKDEDLTTTLGRGKKKVKAGRIPLIFREQPVKQKATRPPPKNRLTSFVESESESDEVLSSSLSSSSEKEPSESYVKEASETERLIEEIKQLRTKNECLQKKNNMLLEENKLLKLQRLSFENLCENKEQFCSATGINPDCFMRLFNYLNPGEDCSNITFYDTSKRFSEEKYTNSEEVKSGPKPKISAKEQLFKYLSWLKNGFTLSHVSFLFQTPKATVSRYIVTWIDFLYYSLGSIPIWPTREQFIEEMPEIFKRTYPSTPLLY